MNRSETFKDLVVMIHFFSQIVGTATRESIPHNATKGKTH